jgi:hypothetical protein
MPIESKPLPPEFAEQFLKGIATVPKPPETTLEQDEADPALQISHDNPCEKSEEICEFMTEQKQKAIRIIQGAYSQTIPGLKYSPEEIAFLDTAAKLHGYESAAEYVRYVTLNVIMHPVVLKPESKTE